MRSAVFLVSLLLIEPSSAAGPDLAQRERLVKGLQKCVYVASNRAGEPNLVAEEAFMACKTEEDALRTWLVLNFVAPNVAEAFIIREKLQIKASVVELNRLAYPTR